MKDYSTNLDQASRLALCPVSPFVTIRDNEESEETARLNNHPMSARSCGFTMPSRARTGIVSILPHGADDSDEGESAVFDDSESEELPAETWAPYVLPSARNRGAVYAELRGMGVSMEG